MSITYFCCCQLPVNGSKFRNQNPPRVAYQKQRPWIRLSRSSLFLATLATMERIWASASLDGESSYPIIWHPNQNGGHIRIIRATIRSSSFGLVLDFYWTRDYLRSNCILLSTIFRWFWWHMCWSLLVCELWILVEFEPPRWSTCSSRRSASYILAHG